MKKLNRTELITYIITIFVCVDVLLVQWPGIIKVNQTFPSISVLGFTLTLNELIVSIYVILATLYVFTNIAKTNFFKLGPNNLKYYIFVLYLLLIYSFFHGLVNSNGGLILEIRSFIIPTSLYFIFINLPLRENFFLRISKIIYRLFLIIGILNFINLLIPTLYSNIIPLVGNNQSYYNISMTSLVLFHSFFSIIYKIDIKKNILIALVFFVSSVFYLIKASIFGLFVTFGIILFWFWKQKSKVAYKIIFIIAILIISTYIIYDMQPIESKIQMISFVEFKFFNINRGIDISTGRFDIWLFYLKESLRGYGLTPDGFGYISHYVDPRGIEFWDKGAHNILVYYAYNFGLFAMAILIIIIIKYYNKVSKVIMNISQIDIRIRYLTYYFWTISIIVINLGNLSIFDYRLAWVFWLINADFTNLIMKSSSNINN